jgi:tRNA-(ms[2]io[6]A)-hydroxylase
VEVATIDDLPLHSRTPQRWGQQALADPTALLNDHAFLEKKAAINAMELMVRWPDAWTPGWVEALTGIARDEAAHLSQAVRVLTRRGGQLTRGHRSSYANALRTLVRKAGPHELLDRLLVSGLIEARSCERFGLLALAASEVEPDLAAFYNSLCSSEMGHYKTFLKLAGKVAPPATVESRWQEMLAAEARIMAEQTPGSRIHSWVE